LIIGKVRTPPGQQSRKKKKGACRKERGGENLIYIARGKEKGTLTRPRPSHPEKEKETKV